MLFINIGWMKRYAGQSDDDPTIGNHGYLKENIWGHEAWNFKPYRGYVYGYVPGRPAQINLKLLGGKKHDDFCEGVTVVFIARDPRIRQTRIVGWYKNSTVYRLPGSTTLQRSADTMVQYSIFAKAEDATLLPVIARSFQIPTAKKAGNLGQSTRWYGGTEAFRASVLNYIVSGGSLLTLHRTGRGRNSNLEERRAIEKAAVDHATKYYESVRGGRWKVDSREVEGVGWDLDVVRLNEHLKVEVKGSKGNRLCVELTPNEYSKMMSKEHRVDYVVYVVTKALEKIPESHVFYYNSATSSNAQHIWESEDGRRLVIKQLIGAELTVDTTILR